MPTLENKSSAEVKLKPKLTSIIKSVQLQQLQDEIDKLALLVNEAKRQSDRIQAAADALGDAVFEDVGATVLPFTVPDKLRRKTNS